MEESTPETQPSGSLTPPPSGPTTAIATSAPLPPRPVRVVTTRRTSLREIADRALDRLDSLGDGIAELIGLR